MIRQVSGKYLQKEVFVHYGPECYFSERVKEIGFYQNHYNKPKVGGLWFSPLHSSFGWRDWCRREDYSRFNDRYRWEVQVHPDSKIVLVQSFLDLKALPTKELWYGDFFACTYIDYGKLLEMGFDGVFLSKDMVDIEDRVPYYYGYQKPTFRFWNCESLLLFSNKRLGTVQCYVQGV